MLDHIPAYELIHSIQNVHGEILRRDENGIWLWKGEERLWIAADAEWAPFVQSCLADKRITLREVNTSERTVFQFFIPVLDETGTGRMALVFEKDMTEEKKAERLALLELENFAQITRHSPDAIVTLDEQGLIRSWNVGAQTLFGYGREEMIGRPAQDLFSTEAPFLTTLHSLPHMLDLKDIIKDSHTVCRTSTGDTLICELTLAPLHESGNLQSLLVLRDRTAEVHLAESRQRSLANLAKINEMSALIHRSLNIEDIIDMILVAATAGQGFRFNRAFLMLVNSDRTRLEGRKAIGPSDPEEAGRLWSELSQTQETLQEILLSYGAVQDGTDYKVNQLIGQLSIPLSVDSEDAFGLIRESLTRQMSTRTQPGDSRESAKRLHSYFGNDHLAIVPLPGREGPSGILICDNAISGRSITEEDLATLQIFANQVGAAIENAILYSDLQEKVRELELAHASVQESQERLVRSEKLAAVGEMSAKMAHEIRNPLVAVGGFARAILSRPHLSENMEYIRIIADEALRLERILTDALRFIKSNEPQRESVSLEAALRTTVSLVQERCQSQRIEIIEEYLASPFSVEADTELLQQVFQNLLINAVDAMPRGGTLLIRMRETNDAVELDITDSGEGIAEQDMDKIFDLFYTTKQKGTGLGLPIVHDILDKHHWKHRLDSIPGQGTTFTIVFPR